MPPLPTAPTPPDPEPLLVPNSPFPQATWERAAVLLAAGARVGDVAVATGISRGSLWRARQTQPRFVARIREWENRVRRDREARFSGLTDLVMDGLARRLAEGDVRTLLWAAKRLGIGIGEWLAAPSEVPQPEGADAAAVHTQAVHAQAERGSAIRDPAMNDPAKHRAYIMDLLAASEARIAEHERVNPLRPEDLDEAAAIVRIASAERRARGARALADADSAASGWSPADGPPPDPFGDQP